MSAIYFTQAAIEKASADIARRAIPGLHLRLGVKGSGGCAGFQYFLDYESVDKRPSDIQFEFDSVIVLIDPKSLKLLSGATIDYESSLLKQSFVIDNPNERKRCGCGKSFDVK
jgi:iron-sulfur cluster assembly protein